MKTSTRQYAKRQVSWLRNKLLPAVRAANMNSRREGGGDIVPVYLLDASGAFQGTPACSALGPIIPFRAWRRVDGQRAASGARRYGRCAPTILTRPSSSCFMVTTDFLEQRPLPDPRALSSIARDLLSIADKPTEYACCFCDFGWGLTVVPHSPAAVLHARRKTICPICTCDEEKPVMIEEGEQWVVHIKTRRHRRAAARSQRDSRGESGAVDRAGDTEIAEPSVL